MVIQILTKGIVLPTGWAFNIQCHEASCFRDSTCIPVFYNLPVNTCLSTVPVNIQEELHVCVLINPRRVI